MLTDLRVRERRAGDLARCVEVLRAVHEADGYPMRWPADPTAFAEAEPALAAWVAERDGLVVGQAVLRASAGHADAERWAAATGLGADAHGLVARVFVDPGAQRLGIGGRLLATAAGEARRLGLWPVLDVMAGSAAAIALYERLGWRRVATRSFTLSDGSEAPLHCYVAPAP